MKRWSVLLFGVASYVVTLATFLYLAGFVGGILVPTRLDGPLTEPLAQALSIDMLLVALFGLQHSVMARPGFKEWWTRLVPQPIERSVYCLATSAVLGLLFWQWRPLGGVIWDLEQPLALAAAWTLYAVGWLGLLATTFYINHFDLFGLRQVWRYFRGRPYTHLPFATPGPYRFVRHPIYVGWLTAFWVTPTMTFAHFVFAAGMTAYILIAIVFEERDLVRFHTAYADYRRRIPMFIPNFLSPATHSTTTPRPRPLTGRLTTTVQEH